MSLNADDEILQDFLVEAGEILEQLGAQLVELEQRPSDFDLLNAVFRGFHTIKGGAGFLNITALVEVCHRAEDVFNTLRQGQRRVDAILMDAVLKVLDVVNAMFNRVRAGQEPDHADPALLHQLTLLTQPAGAEPEPAPEPVPASRPAVAGQGASPVFDVMDDISVMLTPPDEKPIATASSGAHLVGGDDMTDDEFEALLDHLQASGQGSRQASPPPSPEPVAAPQGRAPAIAAAPSRPDEITDMEFEALLDNLHGKGKFAVAAVPPPPAPAKAAPSPLPPPPPPRPPVPPPVRHEEEESRPAIAAPPAQAETSVRVDTQRLDAIMNMVGELVLVRNRLATLRTVINNEDVANAVSNLDVVTSDLQLAVMKTRMQPIKKVFGRFPRVVRDLARTLKKEIDLELVGEETDLDKNLVEALADPLIHLVRNAVDHGIETPAEREQSGKPRKGKIVLSAAQEGDHIRLSITDNGKGMDPEALRHKVVEKGLMDAETAARLDEKSCFQLIFMPGFSTKTEISDVSGRGVGMDVVKTRIAQMNGRVDIHSELGHGSTIDIKLPLTLAILPTLMVVLGKQPFALPLASVVEIFNLDLSRTNVVDGQLTIRVRERALPLFYLRKWLVPKNPKNAPQGHTGHVVVVNVGHVQVGLVVDDLIGQEEVVIKPLGAMLQGLPGMAGATITGDGKIAMILDVPGLMRRYAHRRH